MHGATGGGALRASGSARVYVGRRRPVGSPAGRRWLAPGLQAPRRWLHLVHSWLHWRLTAVTAGCRAKAAAGYVCRWASPAPTAADEVIFGQWRALGVGRGRAARSARLEEDALAEDARNEIDGW